MKPLIRTIKAIAALICLATSVNAQTAGYFAAPSGPYGGAANNGGLNIGQTFTVANTNIQVFSLGVYDFGGDGLNSAHTVTLFSNQTALASVTVPAGTSATLLGSFRFAALPSPITLMPGTYSVVAYQMNGTANTSDGYADAGNPNRNGFNGTFNIKHSQTIYEFTTSTTAYPGTGGGGLGTSGNNLASASFTYSDPNPTTIAYTADPRSAQYGGAANNSGLNIGHTFTVTGGGIQIQQLGVFDYQGNGLNAAHTVTLFTTLLGNQVPLASVTVPAGTSAVLGNGFRFMPLATALTLTPGSYSIISYQMNGNAGSDPYCEGNVSGFNAVGNVGDAGFSPYEFVTNGSPAYPSGGANVNFACVSFTYSPLGTNSSSTVAYTASTNGAYGVAGDNSGLNIGHTFTVTATNIQISHLGVYDYAGNGLKAAHTVTLFASAGGTYMPISGGTVTVPAGTNAPLTSGYRFVQLPAPVSLPPATYAVIAYQMNGGTNSDPYSDASGSNNGFNGSAYVQDSVSVYEFTTNASPSFPGTGGGNSGTPTQNFGCASFIYSLVATSSVAAYGPTVSPAFAYVNIGQTVNLTADAYGTPPISYQWYYGNALTPIANATNATLTLTNIQAIHTLGNEGKYTASAGNAYGGQVTGSNAQVIIIPPVSPLKIMPLGDSITYGQGALGGYRAPLYQSLTAANFNVNFVGTQNNNPTAWLPQPNHEGHSGYRIDQISSGFLSWVNSVPSPDIILLMIGTNDYGQNYDTANATNRLDQLITLIATNRPNAKLFVANLTLRTDNAGTESAIENTFNPYVPGIVANHAALGQRVYFVDMHAALSASDLIDNLHPNQSGYNKMAAAWLQAITRQVPPPGSTNAMINLNGTNATITYSSVPGFQYVTERSTNLNTGSWMAISTNTVPGNGIFQVNDGAVDLGGNLPAAAFYRLLLR